MYEDPSILTQFTMRKDFRHEVTLTCSPLFVEVGVTKRSIQNASLLDVGSNFRVRCSLVLLRRFVAMVAESA